MFVTTTMHVHESNMHHSTSHVCQLAMSDLSQFSEDILRSQDWHVQILSATSLQTQGKDGSSDFEMRTLWIPFP